jgi:hypothetical protein
MRVTLPVEECALRLVVRLLASRGLLVGLVDTVLAPLEVDLWWRARPDGL